MNANTARQWLYDMLQNQDAVKHHFVAISSKPEKAAEFGIDRNNVFEMWDWVGGRYSLWSTIGLPIALAIGMANFRKLLSGAHAMDQHFQQTEFKDNMPVILALLGTKLPPVSKPCSHSL